MAAVYKDEMTATIYNADNGEIKSEVNFQGKRQSVTVNDSFANPKDNIFEINNNGTLLGASFDDGSLEIYDLTRSGNDMELLTARQGIHTLRRISKPIFCFCCNRRRRISVCCDRYAEESADWRV